MLGAWASLRIHINVYISIYAEYYILYRFYRITCTCSCINNVPFAGEARRHNITSALRVLLLCFLAGNARSGHMSPNTFIILLYGLTCSKHYISQTSILLYYISRATPALVTYFLMLTREYVC